MSKSKSKHVDNSTGNPSFSLQPATSTQQILERAHEGIYLADPVLAAKDMLRAELDPWQERVIRKLLLGEKKRVSVRAGHATGKTHLSGLITNLFIDLYAPCTILATGPTGRQVRSQFWNYVGKIWQNNFLKDSIEWQKTKMFVKGQDQDWFAMWMSSSKDHKHIEGYHAENLLWIIEEAKGVNDVVFEAVQGALSRPNNFLYISSTCGPAKGYFYETHSSRLDMWDVEHVPSWTSPRVDPEKLERWKKEWGEDSPIYQARVAAEFPEEDEYSICPLSWLQDSVIGDDNSYNDE